MKLKLVEMKDDQTGKISVLQGGHAMRSRLEAMGLRPGKRLTKLSGMLGGGPIVVQVEGTQVAVGRGMAARIEVEVWQK